jgi:hypothetical protein
MPNNDAEVRPHLRKDTLCNNTQHRNGPASNNQTAGPEPRIRLRSPAGRIRTLLIHVSRLGNILTVV